MEVERDTTERKKRERESERRYFDAGEFRSHLPENLFSVSCLLLFS